MKEHPKTRGEGAGETSDELEKQFEEVRQKLANLRKGADSASAWVLELDKKIAAKVDERVSAYEKELEINFGKLYDSIKREEHDMKDLKGAESGIARELTDVKSALEKMQDSYRKEFDGIRSLVKETIEYMEKLNSNPVLRKLLEAEQDGAATALPSVAYTMQDLEKFKKTLKAEIYREVGKMVDEKLKNLEKIYQEMDGRVDEKLKNFKMVVTDMFAEIKTMLGEKRTY